MTPLTSFVSAQSPFSLCSCDAASLEQVRRYLRFVLRQAGGEPRDLDDLVQETILKLLVAESKPQTRFRGTHTPSWLAYLKAFARSVLADDRRRRATAKRGSERIVAELRAEEAERHSHAAAPWCDPLAQTIAADGCAEILRQCGATVRQQRDRPRVLAMVRWAWIEGRSSREIARRLGPPVRASQVDTILARTRRRLQRRTGLVLPRRTGARRSSPRELQIGLRRCASSSIPAASRTRRPPAIRSGRSD